MHGAIMASSSPLRQNLSLAAVAGPLQRAFEGFAGPRRPAQLDDESRAVYARAAAARSLGP